MEGPSPRVPGGGPPTVPSLRPLDARRAGAARAARAPRWRSGEAPGALALAAAPARALGRIVRWRDLLVAGVGREVAARFRGSALGVGWALVSPLLLLAVYGFVFTRLLGLGVAAGDMPVPLVLFVGVVAWSGFAEGLARATPVWIEHRGELRALPLPAELLVLQRVLAATLVMLVGLAAAAAAGAVFGGGPSLEALAAVPSLLSLQVLLAWGLGLVLATLHVFVRDVEHLLGVGLTVWMLATPIFWSIETTPAAEPYRAWLEVNPLAVLVAGWRSALLGVGGTTPAEAWAAVGPLALGLFAAGCALCARVRGTLADEV